MLLMLFGNKKGLSNEKYKCEPVHINGLVIISKKEMGEFLIDFGSSIGDLGWVI